MYKTIRLIGIIMATIAGDASSLSLNCLDFKNNGTIPREFTGEGANKRPTLVWDHVPHDTRSLVIFCEDPDAPGGTWIHWVAYNIPATNRSSDYIKLSAKEMPDGTMQGLNSWLEIGYKGPFPPQGHGPHHYYFVLYALDTVLPLQPGATKAMVEKAMQGHIRARAQIVGLYERHAT